MLRSTLCRAALLATLLAGVAGAQQSDLSIGPFVTFLPTAGASPLAGLALTIASGPLGFRASGHMPLENRSAFSPTDARTRPWGADADALLFFGGLGAGARGLAPYVFAGVSTATVDSGVSRVNQQGWSYGGGLTLPLGSVLDVFGEARYRMSRYVLPSAVGAPVPTREFRIGLSFHVGNGGSSAHRSVERSGRVIPSARPTAGHTAPSAGAARVLNTADNYLGVPYRYGGTSPSSGFDCSGFVQYVFAKHGVELPRTSREQARVGVPLSADWRAVIPGDLVMFEEGGRIGHVAIYAGRNRIIHSTSSGGGVRYDDLTTQRGQWFVDHMVAARRVTPDANGMMLDLARGFSSLGVELDGPDHAPQIGIGRR